MILCASFFRILSLRSKYACTKLLSFFRFLLNSKILGRYSFYSFSNLWLKWCLASALLKLSFRTTNEPNQPNYSQIKIIAIFNKILIQTDLNLRLSRSAKDQKKGPDCKFRASSENWHEHSLDGIFSISARRQA